MHTCKASTMSAIHRDQTNVRCIVCIIYMYYNYYIVIMLMLLCTYMCMLDLRKFYWEYVMHYLRICWNYHLNKWVIHIPVRTNCIYVQWNIPILLMGSRGVARISKKGGWSMMLYTEHVHTRGVWEHAPPGNYWNLHPLRLFLVASKSTIILFLIV